MIKREIVTSNLSRTRKYLNYYQATKLIWKSQHDIWVGVQKEYIHIRKLTVSSLPSNRDHRIRESRLVESLVSSIIKSLGSTRNSLYQLKHLSLRSFHVRITENQRSWIGSILGNFLCFLLPSGNRTQRMHKSLRLRSSFGSSVKSRNTKQLSSSSSSPNSGPHKGATMWSVWLLEEQVSYFSGEITVFPSSKSPTQV